MNMLRSPLFYYTILFVAGYLLQADFSIAADPVIPDCENPCRVQHRDCFDKAIDSPNDIERATCDNERNECFAQCAAETKVLQEELQIKVLQEQQDKALLEPPVKRSTEEREEDYEKATQEKLEQQEKAAQEQKEQQEKAAQEKLENETLNGTIKIYQFK